MPYASRAGSRRELGGKHNVGRFPGAGNVAGSRRELGGKHNVGRFPDPAREMFPALVGRRRFLLMFFSDDPFRGGSGRWRRTDVGAGVIVMTLALGVRQRRIDGICCVRRHGT